MFSGIVEQMAQVVSFERRPRRTARISLDLGTYARGIKLGDSVAVNGTCLTVTAVRKSVVSFDVIEETLRLTNLGKLAKSTGVNVERGLTLGDRIDGHLVTGHIDGTGKIIRTKHLKDGSVKVTAKVRPTLASMMVKKGSVAVDGVSLTIVEVTADSFSVCLIPRTLSITTMGRRQTGDFVNIEVDLIAKYVKRFLQEEPETGQLKPT